MNSVTVDDKTMTLPENRGMVDIGDSGLAAEIDTRYGKTGEVMPGDVVVVPYEAREPGHRNFFAVPELPWKKEKRNG